MDYYGGRSWGEFFSDIFSSSEIKKYTYESLDTLKKYGNIPIKQLTIYKTPLKELNNILVNAISLNTYDKIRKDLGEKYDEMFHLALVATLENNVMIIMEKHANIRIATAGLPVNEKTQTLNVPVPNNKLTIMSMTENARRKMGDKVYFAYSALNGNNCQNYVLELLQNSGITITPQIKDFVFQDISKLVEQLPKHVPIVSDVITKFWALKDRWFGKGAGIYDKPLFVY